MKNGLKRQCLRAPDQVQALPVLPTYLIRAIGVYFACGSDKSDCFSCRRVCKEWNLLVAKYTNPRLWCGRLWIQKGDDAIDWPRDNRFCFFLAPAFLNVILFNEVVTFTWEQLAPLVRRMMYAKESSLEDMEQKLWREICLRKADSAVSRELVVLILSQDSSGSFFTTGLTTLLLSPDFHSVMLEVLKSADFSKSKECCVLIALSFLHIGVWCSSLDISFSSDETVSERAWSLFVESQMVNDVSVLTLILQVFDSDFIENLEEAYGKDRRFQDLVLDILDGKTHLQVNAH